MENGYLGGIILAASFVVLALIYKLYRKPRIPAALDRDSAATILAFLVTGCLAAGATVFAGNAYLTDTFSTLVSAGVVLASLVVLAFTIARSRSYVASATATPSGPVSAGLPPAANANTRISQRRARRKAA